MAIESACFQMQNKRPRTSTNPWDRTATPDRGFQSRLRLQTFKCENGRQGPFVYQQDCMGGLRAEAFHTRDPVTFRAHEPDLRETHQQRLYTRR